MNVPTENKNVLLSLLLHEMADDLKELDSAYIKGDFVAFDFVILRVRGSTLHFGMDKLSQSCSQLLGDGQTSGHMAAAFKQLYRHC